MYIDTHAHLDVEQYDSDREQVIKNAIKNGVGFIVNPSFDLQSAKKAIDLANKYENIFAGVGCHPKTREESGYVFNKKDYLKIIGNKKVVAVGECGLELASSKIPEGQKQELLKHQKEIFVEQINLAKEFNLPIIVHCRNTHKEVIEILSKENNLQGVIHCFSGSWGDAQKYLEMGIYISFTGIITYANDYDKVVKNTPLDRILIETDCPYLSPVPLKGQRNEPANVKYVAQRIAEIKGEPLERVADITTQNAKKLFNLS
ncbi:MAG: TatD family hydrolase [Candidatus Pacebacteria bacterium]|nr:TatD family hydrolase [Candidatus Paceibacterota bacterium]